MTAAPAFLPSEKLITLQFSQSRQRSAKRHNRHVLRDARRRARNKRIKLIARAITGGAAVAAVALPIFIYFSEITR